MRELKVPIHPSLLEIVSRPSGPPRLRDRISPRGLLKFERITACIPPQTRGVQLAAPTVTRAPHPPTHPLTHSPNDDDDDDRDDDNHNHNHCRNRNRNRNRNLRRNRNRHFHHDRNSYFHHNRNRYCCCECHFHVCGSCSCACSN